MSINGDHAIVIGGSLSGLMVAAVLSEHVDRVTIVESDDLPDGPATRRGVPQGFHLHTLPHGGRTLLDEFIGSFTAEAQALGFEVCDGHQDIALRITEGWVRRAPSDMRMVFGTRWSTEHVVRTQVSRMPGVQFHQGRVTGLVRAGTRAAICGVRVDSASESAQTLTGDLVVDASGRGSRAPQWVEELGFQAPRRTSVQSYLGYATVRCAIPDDAWPGDIRAFVAPPAAGCTRGALGWREENGLVGIMAAGQNRDYPPGDPEGFGEFLRTSITGLGHHLWQQGEQQTEIRTTKTSTNQLTQWADLREMPRGLAVVGDAVAAFNPVYGQGITSAAVQVRHVRDRLREADRFDELHRGLATGIADASAFAWASATGADLAFPDTVARGLEPAEADPASDEYFAQVRTLSVHDAHVAGHFVRAMQTMDPALLFADDLVRYVRDNIDRPRHEQEDLRWPPEWSDRELSDVADS